MSVAIPQVQFLDRLLRLLMKPVAIPQVQFLVKVIFPSGVFGQTAQKTVDFPQLQFIAGRRHPGHGADSHGFPCSEDHRDSATQYFPGGRCPCCAGLFPCRLSCTTDAHGSDSADSVEVPQVLFLRGGGRRSVVAATSSSCWS